MAAVIVGAALGVVESSVAFEKIEFRRGCYFSAKLTGMLNWSN